MPRTKGSKNKKTLAKEKAIAELKRKNPKIKKIVQQSGSKDYVPKRLEKARKAKETGSFPSHVLPLEYPFYIEAQSTCFALKEVIEDGNDKNICYASRLIDMLQMSVNRNIRVPLDVQEMTAKLERIYNMLSERIEFNARPSDLFEEYNKEIFDE